MSAALAEGRFDDYQRLLFERIEQARVRREALACCIECRNPLLATEDGFQFCPYERARQHARIARLCCRAPPGPSLQRRETTPPASRTSPRTSPRGNRR